MTTIRCSVCSAGISIARYVDASADLTAAALSRQAATVGMDLSADRILTHRAHRKAEEPAGVAKTKRDFAALMRDRIADAVEKIEPVVAEDGTEYDPILHKDLQPAIASGLKAQAIIDKREQVKGGKGNAELAFAIIAMLTGGTPPPVAALDDGNTIEGTAVDVTPE